MRYLIDTDWVVEALRGSTPARVRILELLPAGIAISVISMAELFVGPYRSPHAEQAKAELLEYVGPFTLLPIDSATGEIFGRMKASLQLRGQPIGNFDTLIAATALQHGLTLLTNNRRHFERIGSLRVESG